MQKKYMGNFGGTSIIKDQSLLNHEAIKQQIVILDELRDLIPPLQTEEYNQLEKNILVEGCREALLIWQTTANVVITNSTETSAVYILIDGHNRYSICLKHKLNFKIHLISFDSLKDVRDYMIDNQLGRRNLIPEQASYLRGLRYNTEKQEKGKYAREDHKGQNVPYALADSKSTENEQEKHKGQNVPYGSMTHKESTSERLSKQYNVSEKTIKRDAEFAEGLNLLSSELKKEILSGRVKVKKSDIQQLTQIIKPESPIESITKISELISANPDKNTSKSGDESFVTFNYKNKDSRESLLKKVKKSMKNASELEIMVEIKGTFIINNGLIDAWKKLRGFSENVIIDENFTDKISIFQAANLGIIQML